MEDKDKSYDDNIILKFDEDGNFIGWLIKNGPTGLYSHLPIGRVRPSLWNVSCCCTKLYISNIVSSHDRANACLELCKSLCVATLGFCNLSAETTLNDREVRQF